jgi:hypothetical protein
LTKPLWEFLPPSSNGSILITSRNKEVALRIVDPGDVIEIGPLSEPEALELLRRNLGVQIASSGTAEPVQILEQWQASELVRALDFMPLAIVQAAGYITHHAPRCSIPQYLSKIRNSDLEAIKLLKYEAGHPRRDWDAKNSIIVTWQISFDHIRQSRQSAADLLCLMSFFDRQGIPEVLLFRREQQHNNDPTSDNIAAHGSDESNSVSDIDTSFDLEEDFRILRDYSLISISQDGSTFSMHRLVQLSVQTWLKSQGKPEHYKEQFIHTLYETFPSFPDHENKDQCRSLFPHIKAAMLQRPTSDRSLQEWAGMLCRGAMHAHDAGDIRASKEMASKSMEQREKLLGANHLETLSSASVLVQAYLAAGQWAEAENLEIQIIESFKIKFGESHLKTQELMGNLAWIYSTQERWLDAAKLKIRVMEQTMVQVNQDHPSLQLMNNLSIDLRALGHLEKARELGLFALAKHIDKLGEDHPDTLISKCNLALTFAGMEQWEEAESLQIEALKTLRVQLGDDHPLTLEAMGFLASTWKALGQTVDALGLLRRCLARAERVLGPDHPKFLQRAEDLLKWEAEESGGDNKS